MQFFRKSKVIAGADAPRAGGPALLDVQATLLSYPGPALVVDSRLAVQSMNREGEILGALLDAGDEDAQARTLREAIREATILDMPTQTRVDLVDFGQDQARRFFDISVLPCAAHTPGGDGGGHGVTGQDVLVLARETTLDKSVMEALVKSRELYGDLLRCSSDFAWETDQEGCFKFASERGVAGYSAEELNALPAELLIDRSANDFEPDWTPFCVTFPIENVETWVKSANGEACCLLVSAVPILDDDGNHTGTRGACVDATELRSHERSLRETADRDALVEQIVSKVRREFNPGDMLGVAARETKKVLGSRSACVLTLSDDRQKVSQVVWSEASIIAGDVEEQHLFEELRAMGSSPFSKVFHAGGRSVLLCGTSFDGEINGGLVLVRHNSDALWTDAERMLLRHIADQMGIVIARAMHAAALEELSRIDPMTQILNRRAFYEDADLCLVRNSRAGLPATYIYFDLDDFKRVNDTLGHGAGDRFLIEFALTLQSVTRRGDLAVRLGGDEFGLLLDNCDRDGAIAKTETVLAALEDVSERAGVPWPLSVSAGIAVWAPGSETIEEVMERADSVLYEAKAAGKNAWRLAAPCCQTECQTGRQTSHAGGQGTDIDTDGTADIGRQVSGEAEHRE